MPRVPLAAVWLLAGLIPLSVGALGLGEISLKSALNQVLVAEIPVTADTSDDLSQLDVRLAAQRQLPGLIMDYARRQSIAHNNMLG